MITKNKKKSRNMYIDQDIQSCKMRYLSDYVSYICLLIFFI